ncbi:MAG: ABC transporter permease subunit [Eubacteriales bacterium]|nr:ABC transporter permease subunit [Eubacteriales bacterium]
MTSEAWQIQRKDQRARKRRLVLKQMKSNYFLYLFLLPAVVYLAIFAYAPMYGIQIAFKNFKPSKGITGSAWVGLKYFETFFNSPRFWTLLSNTLLISLYTLLAGFPMPIVLALMLNYIKSPKLKKFTQTVTYAPHFISLVVMVGMLNVFLSPRSGFVNTLITSLGGQSVFFMGSPDWFRHLYVWSGVWQSAGWGSIIYLAALSGVAPELHEAAIIDGANKFQRILSIDLPTIMPTMVILLIMNFGSVMNVGYEKVFLMQNNLNLTTSEVISTYTYKLGLQNAEYSYSTAIGLFNNVINFSLLLIVNRAARKLSGSSLW